MKRSPLRRGTSQLKRTAGPKRSRMKRKPRRARPDKDDPERIAWIRQQPCAVCGALGCDPHHKTGAGMGARARDDEAMPLCRKDHDDLDNFDGFFEPMNREDRDAWQDAQIDIYRELYELHRRALAARAAVAGPLEEPF